MNTALPDLSTTPDSPPASEENELVLEAESLCASLQRARDAIAGAILGQDEVIEQTLITLLCGGHALLVGLPGLGKTSLVHATARALGMQEGRIQFTPDLLPGDILGSEILEDGDDGRRSFRFLPGPIFCRLLMADEINRASPRTQSALLQGMQEKFITVAGKRYDLPTPFHVLATQNPIEQEGTYPLPEAQLDRFLMHIEMRYPNLETEQRILIETTGEDPLEANAALSVEDLLRAQTLVRRMPVGERVANMILRLIRSARPDDGTDDQILWGPSSRAGQALMLASRARALLQGRFAPSSEDVHALAVPILRHRMALRFEAIAAGTRVEDLILERANRADTS
ncbi:MAG: MoxR family ATPase [Hyphomicrobiales bacterium]|nr:MoxR family ATPase [Hyphomicrobiales bacterium]